MKRSKFNSVLFSETKGSKPYYVLTNEKTDYLDVLHDNKNYMQTSMGLNCLSRNMIVLDCDEYEDEKPFKDFVVDKATSLGFPLPNLIKTHYKEDRETYQAFWFLDSTLTVKDSNEKLLEAYGEFKNAIKYVNQNFCGDPNFTGYWCKNPYYESNAFSNDWISKTARYNISEFDKFRCDVNFVNKPKRKGATPNVKSRHKFIIDCVLEDIRTHYKEDYSLTDFLERHPHYDLMHDYDSRYGKKDHDIDFSEYCRTINNAIFYGIPTYDKKRHFHQGYTKYDRERSITTRNLKHLNALREYLQADEATQKGYPKTTRRRYKMELLQFNNDIGEIDKKIANILEFI